MSSIWREALYGVEVEIPVPDDYSRIGIAMSGGMDSTLLAALLLPHLDCSKVTIYTVDQKQSIDTVTKILSHLGYHLYRECIPDPKNENGALSPVFLDICTKVDYFYTGINRNPPWADDIPDGQKPHRFNKTQYQNLLMPFGLLHKNDLLYLYEKEFMDLLPLTHTCTERPHGEKSCGVCFACRERKWAFEHNRITDTVIYEQ